MKRLAAICFILVSIQGIKAQDTIERAYFKDARAKNASIAAARYAEEGYYYTKFTTYVRAVDSSRVFADTALFFVKRAMMLADTALGYAPPTNYPAVDYLNSGLQKTHIADTIIREFYPMSEIDSHRYFGTQASLHLSTAVMDYFNASLLLRGDDTYIPEEDRRYKVLPFSDEIVRLEADEASFQHAENVYQEEISTFENIYQQLSAEYAKPLAATKKRKIESWMEEVNFQLNQSTSDLRDVTHRIEEIRQLLDSKYLKDVADVEPPEHTPRFETDGPSDKIEMDALIPDGLVYKIQLGYYPANVDVENFHGLFPISGETVRQDLARFYAGLFFTYSDASQGKEYIRTHAIPNAFVVPFLNGEKIGLSRAIEIERQRGVK